MKKEKISYYADSELLERIKPQVLAKFSDKDGSIMYMGSLDDEHFFKGKASRKNVVIKERYSYRFYNE